MACKRSPVRSRYSPPSAQMRVTNTVDFKSKSTVFLCLSASKFIAILQILCKIKVEVHMDLVSAINFYPADFSKMWRQVEERKALNAAFAHDLRTPLTVLKGYNEMLQTSDNSQTRETAATMGKHISRIKIQKFFLIVMKIV